MNPWKKILEFKVSIAITLAIIAAFFLLSKTGFFIPLETIQSLSFNQATSPQNLFWFWLVHASPSHLIANTLGILVFGIIVEKKIGSGRTAGLFFIGTIGAPLLFTFFSLTLLVGASGGLAGLIAAALLLAPKKTFLGAVLALVVIAGIAPVLSLPLNNQQQAIQQQTIQTQSDLATAIEQKNPEQQHQLEQKLQELQVQNKQLLETRQFQTTIPIENWVHAIGAILGILFLLWAAPKTVRKQVKQISLKTRQFFHQ